MGPPHSCPGWEGASVPGPSGKPRLGMVPLQKSHTCRHGLWAAGGEGPAQGGMGSAAG